MLKKLKRKVSFLLSGSLGRFIRASASIAAAGALAGVAHNPKFIALAPVIQAVGKEARDQFPDELGWIPL